MLAVGTDQTNEAEAVGQTFLCARCGVAHMVEHTESQLLQFVRCITGSTHIIGLRGKRISKARDASV